MLKQFLQAHSIDIDALSRIKHRLFVVGRFNVRKGPDPDVYLFTNRRDIADAYAPGTFTAIKEMNFQTFVDTLRPAIAERVRPGDIPMIEQFVPAGGEDEESTSTIDDYNYFFWRATSNSNQPAFKGQGASAVDELLQEGNQQAGKGIFRIIRRNLTEFCEFQPRVPDIVDALSALLGICARENGMPAYAAGGALPAGLPERLIDFLFAENPQLPFSLEGLDFSGEPWGELAASTGSKSRESFVKVITAFRDALLEEKYDMFAAMRFGGRSLGQQARSVLKPNLIKDFKKARDAFNGMRQILRSKVLLSMVLEWVFTAYYDIDVVKAIPSTDEDGRDAKVRDIVLREYAEFGVAEPVRRASREERRKFSAALTANFESLLIAVVEDGEKAESHLGRLPDELRQLAKDLREDGDRRRLLRGLSGTELGGDYQKAFISASQTILLDVLCPTLYQRPVLSAQMLRRIFKQESMAAYLSAVFLDDKHQDMVRDIAEQHLDYFMQNIDPESKQIKNKGAVQQRMLKSYLEALARPEVVRRLTEELDVLREMHTLLENTPSSTGRTAGPGRISALRRSETAGDSSSRTEQPKAKIAAPVEQIAQASLEKQIERIGAAGATAAAAAAAGSAAVGGTGTPSDGPDAARQSILAAASGASGPSSAPGGAANDAEPEDLGDRNAITDAIESKVDDILSRALPEERKNVAAMARKVTTELLERDPEFLLRVKNDVSVFEKVLHLIYTRYVSNPDKLTFRNKVDRMTLVNMMLLFQKEIGLGKMCSNLHHMLIDMVEHIDPENPDARDFIRERSLTKYFDDAVLEGKGITNLRTTLKAQAHTNLKNTVAFVSELRGVKYLMDTVSIDKRAEVIVVNATAAEFVDWLGADNLTPGSGGERLRAGKLQKPRSKNTIPPGLVYMTDAAFEGSDANKETFLAQLSQIPLAHENARLVLPPICLSTSHQADDWVAIGRTLREGTTRVPAPVLIVGPSPFMNRKGDPFPTFLPAGYVFSAHFLCQPEQQVNTDNLIGRGEARFQIIGSSVASMRESLDRVVWGDGSNAPYSFAVDFYLYLVLTMLATAAGDKPMPSAPQYWPSFYWTEQELAQTLVWQNSAVEIQRCVLGEPTWFAMQQNLARRPTAAAGNAAAQATDDPQAVIELKSVAILKPEKKAVVQDVAWFNEARRRAELP
ncbi:MAG: hypothetical protein U0Q55_16640 [Vicinamibacterales bacterium]